MVNGHEVILAQWDFPQSENRHHRDKIWYIKAGTIMFILLLISIFTANFLFAGILLMISFVYFYHNFLPQQNSEFAITEGGIIIDEVIYSYSDLDKFWIVYEPQDNVKCLYIEFKGVFKQPLQIPLNDQNPMEIRNYLLPFLYEDLEEDGERISDTINRILRL